MKKERAPQTILEGLLVMAYNVGRAHGSDSEGPRIDKGRESALALLKLVEGVDPGDLAKPFVDLLGPLPDGTLLPAPEKPKNDVFQFGDLKITFTPLQPELAAVVDRFWELADDEARAALCAEFEIKYVP